MVSRRQRLVETLILRTSLLLLFLEAAVVGFWNQFFPESFYNNFPTVNQTPPSSEHFARDFGGATLGIAVLLGIAFLRPHGRFPLPAATAFSVFAIPHTVFHPAHLRDLTAVDAVLLTTANVVTALLGLLVIAPAIAQGRKRRLAFTMTRRRT
jgi:hypothetical protein